MSNARKLIDQLVEEQEHAVVKVELTGTPATVQRALKQLAKTKGGLKKAVGADGTVKIGEPKVDDKAKSDPSKDRAPMKPKDAKKDDGDKDDDKDEDKDEDYKDK